MNTDHLLNHYFKTYRKIHIICLKNKVCPETWYLSKCNSYMSFFKIWILAESLSFQTLELMISEVLRLKMKTLWLCLHFPCLFLYFNIHCNTSLHKNSYFSSLAFCFYDMAWADRNPSDLFCFTFCTALKLAHALSLFV